MSNSLSRRKKLLASWSVQGILILHILGQWVLFSFATCGLLLFIEIRSGNAENAVSNIIARQQPFLVAIIALAPVFIYDLCRLSNRFAGPMVRMQKQLKDLADGKDPGELSFRKTDYWRPMADDFNRIRDRLQRAEKIARSGRAAVAAEVANKRGQAEAASAPKLA